MSVQLYLVAVRVGRRHVEVVMYVLEADSVTLSMGVTQLQLYFNHSGIFATETKTLFGTFAPNDYGPNASTRTGKPGDLPIYLETNDYIHYDYGGNAGPTEVGF